VSAETEAPHERASTGVLAGEGAIGGELAPAGLARRGDRAELLHALGDGSGSLRRCTAPRTATAPQAAAATETAAKKYQAASSP
jgi:hypothetical protein